MVTGLKDGRVVHGARCMWWESISEVGKSASGIPICPHCGGVLFEVENAREWWDQVQRHEDDGHPGYSDFIRWLRGRCFPSLDLAREHYDRHVAEKDAGE